MSELATTQREGLRKPRSLWRDAWSRLLKNRLAVASLFVVAIMSALAILAPAIVPFDPQNQEFWAGRLAPLTAHSVLNVRMQFEKGQVAPSPFPVNGSHEIKVEFDEGRDVFLNVVDDKVAAMLGLPDYHADRIRPGIEQIQTLAVKDKDALIAKRPGGPVTLTDVTIELDQPLPEKAKSLATSAEKTWSARLRWAPRKRDGPRQLVAKVVDGKIAELTVDGAPAGPTGVSAFDVSDASLDGHDLKHRHILGTDNVGRDILSRVLFGGRISLLVGVVATIVSLLIGVTVGAVSGYLATTPVNVRQVACLGLGFATLVTFTLGARRVLQGSPALYVAGPIGVALLFTAAGVYVFLSRSNLLGRKLTTVDDLLMRTVDVLYSIPFMFFVIILLVNFGRNLILLFFALGAVEWLTMARIVRGQVLSLKEKEFIEAARVSGTSSASIIFGHLVPNSLGAVIVYTTLTIPEVILTEAFLSFLGLSVQYQGQNLESWGSLTKSGMDLALGGFPWLLAWSALALSLTLFALNFLGDGLRDALDPRMRGRG